MAKHIFITGTDTNVGKTVISAWLTYHLQAQYWKPIQTGCEQEIDSKVIRNLSEIETHPESYLFHKPVSPHLASQQESRPISFQSIKLPTTHRLLIIEGAGGLLVPINETQTMIDLIQYLRAPIIIVASTKLGTINHTCLTIHAARSHNLNILGVILNGPRSESNKKAIEHYGKINVLAEIEPFTDLKKDMRNLPVSKSLEEKIWKI